MKKPSSSNPKDNAARTAAPLPASELRAASGGGMYSVMYRMAYPDGCTMSLTDDHIGCPPPP
jgi:hypothetical protein